MSLDIDKPWQSLTAENVRRLQGQLGVYQIADAAGRVVYVGYAGGKSLFGLRSELEKHLGNPAKAQFRFEVNMQYQTRYRELLMLHVSTHGELPELNRGEPVGRLGRLG
jgi:hypothetical protein